MCSHGIKVLPKHYTLLHSNADTHTHAGSHTWQFDLMDVWMHCDAVWEPRVKPWRKHGCCLCVPSVLPTSCTLGFSLKEYFSQDITPLYSASRYIRSTSPRYAVPFKQLWGAAIHLFVCSICLSVCLSAWFTLVTCRCLFSCYIRLTVLTVKQFVMQTCISFWTSVNTCLVLSVMYSRTCVIFIFLVCHCYIHLSLCNIHPSVCLSVCLSVCYTPARFFVICTCLYVIHTLCVCLCYITLVCLQFTPVCLL
jgi:hypothetical protein